MPTYTLKIRRYNPGSGEPPYWQKYDLDLAPERSILDAIVKLKEEVDGTIGFRHSCRGAICGSCGVKINGKPCLACNNQVGDCVDDSGEITVEPQGNMPVIKDLIVDMESVHWKKMKRVTPWLLPAGDPPEREYIVPIESMLDITQTVACIQCGSCVSDCLAMEVDPEFIGPAALAKAYRFVGDPRDSQHKERLLDLADNPHGIYDCTHCFMCIDACPKDVAPMDQIMRLRRKAIKEYDITDPNHGRTHEEAFVKIIEKKGTLDESKMIQDSFAPGIKAKLNPKNILPLIMSLPTVFRGIKSGKMRSLPKLIPGVHHKLEDQQAIKRIYEHAEAHGEELNIYITGEGNDGTEDEGAGTESAEEPEAVKSK